MSGWAAEEVQQAAEIAGELERQSVPRHVIPEGPIITIDLSQADSLKEGLAGDCLLIRQLYKALKFDEHQSFKWRLEHKLIQSLILNHYCPGSVPVTCGLGGQYRRYGREHLRQALEEKFPGGYCIKAALGCCSGERGISNMKEQVLESVELEGLSPGDSSRLLDETWIIQERIPIKDEYRVHSLEDQVVDDLAFWRYRNGDPPVYESAPVNAYVQAILDRLPSAVIAHSLCGWDIALTEQGTFVVVELNFSGFHPEYERGFQCSGYFQHPTWGPKTVAHLLDFVERRGGVTIVVNSTPDEESQDSSFYSEIIRWKQIIAQSRQAAPAD
jgi:ATP-grasp domain, R2K clade family 3